jgi:hypothetical protein
MPMVTIKATYEDVIVTVSGIAQGRFTFTEPGMLTGADLREVLEACGIPVRYEYRD